MGSDDIVQTLSASSEPYMRLVCFHHAGGGARAFYEWDGAFDRPIRLDAVELPGRGKRFGESPPSSMADVAGEIVTSLRRSWSEAPPTVFFGHSLGAAVAFATAGGLDSFGLAPVHLVVSGALPHPAEGETPVAEYSDEELKSELREYGGTQQEVLEDPDLMELYLPIIRADLALLEGFEPGPEDAISAPITAIAGEEDHTLETEELEQWGAFTDADLRTKVFEGGHFYLETRFETVVEWLEGHLQEVAGEMFGD